MIALYFCLCSSSWSQTRTHGPCKNQVWYLAQQEIKRGEWLIAYRAVSRRNSPAGVRGETLTIVRPREHPLSNYGTLVRFLPDRTCRCNSRNAINSATIRRFRSIIRKLTVPFSAQSAATIMVREFNFSHVDISLSFFFLRNLAYKRIFCK